MMKQTTRKWVQAKKQFLHAIVESFSMIRRHSTSTKKKNIMKRNSNVNIVILNPNISSIWIYTWRNANQKMLRSVYHVITRFLLNTSCMNMKDWNMGSLQEVKSSEADSRKRKRENPEVRFFIFLEIFLPFFSFLNFIPWNFLFNQSLANNQQLGLTFILSATREIVFCFENCAGYSKKILSKSDLRLVQVI